MEWFYEEWYTNMTDKFGHMIFFIWWNIREGGYQWIWYFLWISILFINISIFFIQTTINGKCIFLPVYFSLILIMSVFIAFIKVHILELVHDFSAEDYYHHQFEEICGVSFCRISIFTFQVEGERKQILQILPYNRFWSPFRYTNEVNYRC